MTPKYPLRISLFKVAFFFVTACLLVSCYPSTRLPKKFKTGIFKYVLADGKDSTTIERIKGKQYEFKDRTVLRFFLTFTGDSTFDLQLFDGNDGKYKYRDVVKTKVLSWNDSSYKYISTYKDSLYEGEVKRLRKYIPAAY
jgi:hypothetical protein